MNTGHGAGNLRCRSLTSGAFTLIEVLIVVALVAILTALIAPSLQGLLGIVGGRGGVTALSGAIEQARLEAIKNGVPAFVGFPDDITNEEAFSSVIICRARRSDEEQAGAGPVIVVSRWLRLPRGVFIDPESLKTAVTTTQSLSGQLPRLATNNVASLRSLKFDRFGKLAWSQTNVPVLRVGEGVFDGSTVRFTPNTNNYYELTIQPLTGHVVVRDAAAQSP